MHSSGNSAIRILGCVVVFGAVSLVSTAGAMQDTKKKKPRAPARRIVLPADSSKAQPPAASDSTVDKLQLPDVLVIGSGGETRRAGSKIVLSPDEPELIRRDEQYAALNPAAIEQGRRREAGGTAAGTKAYQAELGAFGGQFTQYGGHGLWWQDTGEFDYGANAAWRRLGGQFDNSEQQSAEVGLRFGIRPGQGSRLGLFGNYRASQFGLYGARTAGLERELVATSARVVGNARITPQLATAWEAALRKTDLTDTPGSVLETLDNTHVSANLRLRREFENGELVASWRVQTDRYGDPALESLSADHHQAALEFGFGISPNLNARLGARLTAAKHLGETGTKIRPDLDLFWLPSSRFSLQVGFDSGLEYEPWHLTVAANPYLAPRAFPTVEDRLWRVQGGVEWQAGERVLFKASYSRSRVDGYNHFQGDSLGMFTRTATDALLGETILGAELQVFDNFRIDGALELRDDALRAADSSFSNLFDLPYRPQVRLPVAVTYSPVAGIQLGLSLQWVSTREIAVRSPGTSAQPSLPSYLYSRFDVSFRVSPVVELYGLMNNAFNDNYARWDGYREIGFFGLAGLKAKW